jgi:glycerophosphoryl diester phosphodiesterase
MGPISRHHLRFFALLLTAQVSTIAAAHPLIIAHRGASGYLPEHTLAAAAYAHAVGADFIEQDLVMSRDDVLVVLHDIHLDTTTNVAAKYPQRAREDGRFYAIDFDWAELRELRVNERVNHRTGAAVYPQRYPVGAGPFRLCTMEEQLIMIRGLNQSTGRSVGLYPEIKAPSWHADEGKDPSAALLKLLARHHYPSAGEHIFVQCFEAGELRRLREELGTDLPLIQLIGLNSWGHHNADYDSLLTPAGLREIARYAQGIGPHFEHLLTGFDAGGRPEFSSLMDDAHATGLAVHPFTFRADQLPRGVADFDTLLALFVRTAGVDGLFTDHPDLAVDYVRRVSLQSQQASSDE